MMKIIILLTLSIFIAIPAIADDAFEIGIWGNSQAAKDKRVLEIRDHNACSGQIVKIKVDRMPVPNASFEGDKVIEISSDSKIINTWYMPVDEIVLGVAGKSIISGYCNSTKALKINANGKLSSVLPPLCKKLNVVVCPEIAKKEIPNSVYLRCFEYFDLTSGKKRLLAYQGPCT